VLYITANIHFSNSCSDAFSTCFETSTLKITSISILQYCISLKFDMFNIQININEWNILKLKHMFNVEIHFNDGNWKHVELISTWILAEIWRHMKELHWDGSSEGLQRSPHMICCPKATHDTALTNWQTGKLNFGTCCIINCTVAGSDTAEISYTRLRNQQKSNPKSRNHGRNQWILKSEITLKFHYYWAHSLYDSGIRKSG
jgi:hypothetical protein